jgi:hypothetical protein
LVWWSEAAKVLSSRANWVDALRRRISTPGAVMEKIAVLVLVFAIIASEASRLQEGVCQPDGSLFNCYVDEA